MPEHDSGSAKTIAVPVAGVSFSTRSRRRRLMLVLYSVCLRNTGTLHVVAALRRVHFGISSRRANRASLLSCPTNSTAQILYGIASLCRRSNG